jgi:hypothetical protein
VPPPGQTASFTSALVSDGMGGQKTVWTAHGPANADVAFARVFVFNADRGAGVITVAGGDGSYASPAFDGDAGNRIEITFELPNGTRDEAGCFQLELGPMAPNCPVP